MSLQLYQVDQRRSEKNLKKTLKKQLPMNFSAICWTSKIWLTMSVS